VIGSRRELTLILAAFLYLLENAGMKSFVFQKPQRVEEIKKPA
jgi:hypothetical protein